jgi:coenzyme F420-reducing hydrogenase delta subunit
MVTMSAGMGRRFAETAGEFTEKIRALGPNPIKTADQNRHAA